MIFMVTISCNIQYITIDPLKNKTKGHIIKTLNKIKKIYSSKRFIITNVYADNEYDSDDIEVAMRPTKMSIYAANEHVPKIERCIRSIKERGRTM